MTHEEQVLIRGKVFLYKQKAPFVPSGKSVLGALEYREADDKVRCHECGEWFISLSQHLGKSHALLAADYKKRHGLNLTASLCGLRLSAVFSRRSKRTISQSPISPAQRSEWLRKAVIARADKYRGSTMRADSRASELRNESGTCQAQLLGKIREIAEKLGRTPTQADLHNGGISVRSAQLALGVHSLPEVLALAGMAPKRSYGDTYRYTPQMLIELLRAFTVKYGRTPTVHDVQKFKLLPDYGTFKRHFGSMRAAYQAAGVFKGNAYRCSTSMNAVSAG